MKSSSEIATYSYANNVSERIAVSLHNSWSDPASLEFIQFKLPRGSKKRWIQINWHPLSKIFLSSIEDRLTILNAWSSDIVLRFDHKDLKIFEIEVEQNEGDLKFQCILSMSRTRSGWKTSVGDMYQQ